MVEDLDDLNIFALRDFARKIGVKSPTSKTRAEIIKEINDIKSGAKEPNFSTTRHGRPPKTGFQYLSVQNNEPPSKTIIFNQERVKFEYTSGDSVISGYVEIVNQNSAILWQYKNDNFISFYIPSEVCFISPIKTGDFVIAELQFQDGQPVVKKILNINNTPLNSLPKSRADFNKIESVLPDKILKFKNDTYSNLNIKYGENVFISGEDYNLNTQEIINILNSADGTKNIYINISMIDKNFIFLKELRNADCFIAKLTDKTDYINHVLCLAVERIKRLIECKKQVLVAVDDLTTIMSNANFAEFGKNLLSLSKNTKRYGSATILSIVQENSALQKLADKHLKVAAKNLVQEI